MRNLTILFQLKKDKRSYENVTLKMTSSPHITIASLFLALSLKNVLGAINLTDLVISDYDFNDPDDDRVSCTHIICQKEFVLIESKTRLFTSTPMIFSRTL